MVLFDKIIIIYIYIYIKLVDMVELLLIKYLIIRVLIKFFLGVWSNWYVVFNSLFILIL